MSEVTDMMADLAKKKKKKSKEQADLDEDEGADEEGDNVGEFGALKKEKKSKSAATSAFEQQLEEAGIENDQPQKEVKSKYSNVNEDGELDLTYPELLSRFFSILKENNPDLAGDRSGVK